MLDYWDRHIIEKERDGAFEAGNVVNGFGGFKGGDHGCWSYRQILKVLYWFDYWGLSDGWEEGKVFDKYELGLYVDLGGYGSIIGERLLVTRAVKKKIK